MVELTYEQRIDFQQEPDPCIKVGLECYIEEYSIICLINDIYANIHYDTQTNLLIANDKTFTDSVNMLILMFIYYILPRTDHVRELHTVYSHIDRGGAESIQHLLILLRNLQDYNKLCYNYNYLL